MKIQQGLRKRLRRFLGLEEFSRLKSMVIELNNVEELRKLFGWKDSPILNDPTLRDFEYMEDVNERRLRDSETIGTVVCNIYPHICVDIGTSTGHSAALIAVNAPQAKVYTVNIPPEEVASGEGGLLTTEALGRELIGVYYRESGLTNITQILANTAHWEPDLGVIDFAFVDGSHDSGFVVQDTLKLVRNMKQGSFILWHDFNLELVEKYGWIRSVCKGVEKLAEDKVIQGRIFHVRDSWVGLHRIEA